MNPFPFAIYPLSFQKATKKRPQPIGRRPTGRPQQSAAQSAAQQSSSPSRPQIPLTRLQSAIAQAIASSSPQSTPTSGASPTKSIRTTDFDRTARQQEYAIKDPYGNVHSLVASEIDPSSIPARFRQVLEARPTPTNAVKLRILQGKIVNRLAREGIFFQEGKWYFNGSSTGGNMLFNPNGLMSEIIQHRGTHASGTPMAPLPTDLSQLVAMMDPNHPDHADAVQRYMSSLSGSHYPMPANQPIAILRRSLAEFLRGKGFTDEQIEKVINDNHAQHHADAMDLADEHVLRRMRSREGLRWGDEAKKLRPEDLYDTVHRRPAYFIEPAAARKMQEYLDFHAQPFAEGKTHKDTSEAGGMLLGTTSIDPETGTPFVHVLHFVPPGTALGLRSKSETGDAASDITIGRLLHESPALSVVGMVHSHPAGSNWYPSDADISAATTLGSGHPFLSLIQQSNTILRPNRGALKDASDPRGNEPDYVSGPEAVREMRQGGGSYTEEGLGRRLMSREAPDSLIFLGAQEPSMSLFGPHSQTAAFVSPRRAGISEMDPSGAVGRKHLPAVVQDPKTEIQTSYPKSVGYHVPLRGTSAYEFPSQIQVLGMGSTVPFGASMRNLSRPEEPTDDMLWHYQQYETPFDPQASHTLESRHVDLPSREQIARSRGWPLPIPWGEVALSRAGSGIRRDFAALILRQHRAFDHPEHNLPRLRDVVPTTEIKGSETPLPRSSRTPTVDPSKLREILLRMARPKETVRTGQATFAGANEGVADPITQQIAQTKKDTAEKIIGRIRSERASGLNTTISPHTKSFFFAARWLHWT